MTVIDETVDPPVIVFDSDERLLNCTDLIAGNVTLPQRQAVTTGGTNKNIVNVNNTYTLAAVNPAANIVLGGFSVTTFGGSQGISGLGVYNAGGTYIHFQGGQRDIYTGAPINGNVVSAAAYLFYASGGLLRLQERVYLDAWQSAQDITLTLTLLSIRFDYKLFVGTLT